MHYGKALVTNYYQFVLVTHDAQTGLPVIEERYDLVADAAAFWEAARHSHTVAEQHETALRKYLMCEMRRSAALNTAGVVWILASYAREARSRIEVGGANLAARTTIRGQLEAFFRVRFEAKTAEEFGHEAVRLMERSRKSVAQVARDLGVNDNMLYRWRKRYGKPAQKVQAEQRRRALPSEDAASNEAAPIREVKAAVSSKQFHTLISTHSVIFEYYRVGYPHTTKLERRTSSAIARLYPTNSAKTGFLLHM